MEHLNIYAGGDPADVDNPLIVDSETGKCGMWTMPDLGRHWKTTEGVSEYHDKQEVFGQSSADVVSARAKEMISTIVQEFDYLPDKFLDGRRVDRILDVGAGIGDMAIRLAMLGGRVDALDPSEGQLSLLAANLRDDGLMRKIEDELMVGMEGSGVRVDREKAAKRLRLLRGKGEDIGTRKKYDAVVMKFSEQWADSMKLWGKIAKVLKPGGSVFVMTTLPTPGERPNLFLAGWNRYVRDEMDRGRDYRMGNPKNLNVITHLSKMTAALKKLGLELGQTREYTERTKETPEEYIAFLTGIIKNDILRFLEDSDGKSPDISEVIEAVREKMYEVAIERDLERRKIEAGHVMEGELRVVGKVKPLDVSTSERIGILEFYKV